jgi:hypothetical protein
VWLSSASGEEVAQESDILEGSFFAHHLLTGLRGAADADTDGQVSLAEAYRYVYDRTLITSHASEGAAQHPLIAEELAGEGVLVLSRPARASAQLVLDDGLAGEVLVIDEERGHVAAELRKRAGETLRLGLPAGSYRVQVRRAEALLGARVHMPWGGVARIDIEALTPLSPMVALARGAGPLWRSELGAAVLVASPALGFDSPGAGARLSLALVRTHTLSAEARLQLTQARQRNARWDLTARIASLEAGVIYPVTLGPLQLRGGVLLGPQVIVQHGVRRDAARLREADMDAPDLATWAVGLAASPTLQLLVPLWGAQTAFVAVEPSVSLQRVEGVLSVAAFASAAAGLRWDTP